jgi:hypothetical protein
MANLILKDSLVINNFIVKFYCLENEDIDMIAVNELLGDTSLLDFPSKIVEKIQDLAGVSKIEIYNTNNELLVNSEKLIL